MQTRAKSKILRPVATIVIAASDSLNKVRADYVCDGTDDDVQIQAAIDALTAYPGGGRVVLLDGNFNIGSSIGIRGALLLEGQGVYSTRVNLAANVDMLVYDGGSTEGFFCLEGMFCDGKKTSYTGRGLVSNDKLKDVYLNRVFFGYFKEDAIYTEQGWGWVLNQVVIEWGEGNGFVLNSTSSPEFMDCKIIENLKNAIFLQDGHGSGIVNCTLAGLVTDTNDTTYYVLLDCGKDVSAWEVGDSVRNDIGNGDDWTGTIFEISYIDNNELIIVALAVGKDIDDINLADGIENTTKVDTTTLDVKTIHQYCGIRSEGLSAGDNNIVGNQFPMGVSKRNLGVYLNSDRNAVVGNIFLNGHTGIELTTYSQFNTVVGNKLYNQSDYRIRDLKGQSVIKNNDGYVNECSEIISVEGDGAATTITLNHTLDAVEPYACDRIFSITPENQKMSEATYWISSITSTQIVITFSAVLENLQDYDFHIEGKFQQRNNNLSVV